MGTAYSVCPGSPDAASSFASLLQPEASHSLNESAELPAGESKSQYVSPSGTPLLKHGDLKLSQSGAIEAYVGSVAPKFSGLTPQQRAIDGMYAGIKEEMLSGCAKALFTTKKGEDVTKLLRGSGALKLLEEVPAHGSQHSRRGLHQRPCLPHRR